MPLTILMIHYHLREILIKLLKHLQTNIELLYQFNLPNIQPKTFFLCYCILSHHLKFPKDWLTLPSIYFSLSFDFSLYLSILLKSPPQNTHKHNTCKHILKHPHKKNMQFIVAYDIIKNITYMSHHLVLLLHK